MGIVNYQILARGRAFYPATEALSTDATLEDTTMHSQWFRSACCGELLGRKRDSSSCGSGRARGSVGKEAGPILSVILSENSIKCV